MLARLSGNQAISTPQIKHRGVNCPGSTRRGHIQYLSDLHPVASSLSKTLRCQAKRAFRL
jgi:hypothetical protein